LNTEIPEAPRYKPELFQRLVKASLRSNNPVIVTFTKENGETRVMKCTWNVNLIPADKHPHEIEPHKDLAPPPAYVRVFDLEVGDWRSFRWDSVTDVELLNDDKTSND
jgi:hypothetical protein